MSSFHIPITHHAGAVYVESTYGYRPDGEIDSWVMLSTVEGARGPFTAQRLVTYGAWQPDAKDAEALL